MRKSSIPAPAFAIPSSLPDFFWLIVRLIYTFLFNGLAPGA
jgi:hypothetical protein